MKKYKFDLSNLSAGEEMLAFDEILADIICFDIEDEDERYNWYRSVEDYHERCFNDYVKLHKGYKRPVPFTYENDDAWMYAQRKVLERSLGKLTDDSIGNYFMCGNEMDSETQSLWDKVVTEVEEKPQLEYNYSDRFDFNWGR